MVLPASHGVSRAPRYSGYPKSQRPVSPTGLSPPVESLSRLFGYLSMVPLSGPYNPPGTNPRGLGSSAFARRYLRNLYLISFPPGTEMFQFPGFASGCPDDSVLPEPGFPIRTPSDQCLFSGSPKIIAAYRVLHRLSAPRHPPFALSSLTKPSPKSAGTTGQNQIKNSPQVSAFSLIASQANT